MEFMLLINIDPSSQSGDPASPEAQETFAAWMAFNDKLVAGGHWISGASLQPPETATVVRRHDGSTSTTDGPFAETKEQIGGFYLVEAADLDEALGLAADMPGPAFAVEVRPLRFRPQG